MVRHYLLSAWRFLFRLKWHTLLFLFNETAARQLGWGDQAVGKKLDLFAPGRNEIGKSGRVIGVVEDYHFESLHHAVKPLVLTYASFVLQVAGSVHHVGQSMRNETIYTGTGKQGIFRFDVGAGYPEALGLHLKAGRFFDPASRVEDENALIVNEAFLEKQSWPEGLGRYVRIVDKNYTIVGVVDDFKLFGTGATYPSAFFRASETEFSCLAVRFVPGTGKEVAGQIDVMWKNLFPDVTINRLFQSDVFDGFYQTFTKVSGSFGYVAGLALLIACLGLYGLAAQHFLRYVKEVGIRKMGGASVAHVLLLVNREFLISLIIAAVVATALSVVGIQALLGQVRQFTGNFTPGAFPFVLANLIIFMTAAVAVGRQSWNVATINLSEVLKNNE